MFSLPMCQGLFLPSGTERPDSKRQATRAYRDTDQGVARSVRSSSCDPGIGAQLARLHDTSLRNSPHVDDDLAIPEGGGTSRLANAMNNLY